MKITWLGHSCFKVETAQGSVVFDPYEDGRVPGYGLLPRDLSADAVLCSHQHRDHGAVERVTLSGHTPSFGVETLETYHDDARGEKRGGNIIHILSAEGMRLAHMGDIGCELTGAQQAALQGVDVLLIPVGGFYTVDAAQAKAMATALDARVVIPMHYRSDTFGFEVISTLEGYTALCDDVTAYPTNSLTVTADTSRQTAVLTYLA